MWSSWGMASTSWAASFPFGVVTGALRDLIRRVGVDVVRSAGEGGLAALNFLVPGLLDELSAPPDRLRVFDAFATLLARLSHQKLNLVRDRGPALGRHE